MSYHEGRECDAAQERAWGRDALPDDESAVLAKLLTRKSASSLYDCGKPDDAKTIVSEALGEGMSFAQLQEITDLMQSAHERGEEPDHCAIGRIVAECITHYTRSVAVYRGLLS